MRRKARIGLALGSGSARGWAHIGAIRALEERGELEKWVTGLAWTTVVRLMDLTWRPGGLIRGQRLFNLFRDTFRDADIAELQMPFGAVATDLASGRELWLRRGKVLEAVRASCAMPGLFTPVIRAGAVLVDGGLVNPVPVSMCRAMGADLVIAVDLSWGKLGPYRDRARKGLPTRDVPAGEDEAKPADPRIPSMFEVFTTSLDIVEQRVARSRLAGEPADVLITPLLPDFATMDYHRAKEAIAEGRTAVERMAPLIEQVIL